MADIFSVIADATRRDILGILLERYRDGGPAEAGGLSVSQIVLALGLSQPTVSKHLKVLREAGLVSVRERGQHRFYSLQREPLEAVEDWLLPFTGADDEPLGAPGLEVLGEDSLAFATRLGQAAAATTHQIASVVDAVPWRPWRRGSPNP